MMDPDQIPDVAYKWVELSVNRHREATNEETWSIGLHVATERNKTLIGLANVRASKCRIGELNVVPRPLLPSNPNHADIVGFPSAKEDQMALATVLAASIEGNWIPVPL